MYVVISINIFIKQKKLWKTLKKKSLCMVKLGAVEVKSNNIAIFFMENISDKRLIKEEKMK